MDDAPFYDIPEGRLPVWQPLKLNARHLVIIELHLAGLKHVEIAEKMGLHEVTVGLILRSDPAQDIIRQRTEDLSAEFQGKFRQVLDVFDSALDENAPLEVRLAAADKWLKAQGYYQPKRAKGSGDNVTIEDVISELRKGGPVNLNIDARRQTYYNMRDGEREWRDQTSPSPTLKADSPPAPEASPSPPEPPPSTTSEQS